MVAFLPAAHVADAVAQLPPDEVARVRLAARDVPDVEDPPVRPPPLAGLAVLVRRRFR